MTFDDYSLLATRLTGVAVSLFGLHVLYKLLCDRRHGVRLVPLPVIAFTAAWLITLISIQAWLVVRSESAVASGWLRIIYGMAYTWTAAGFIWIAAIGRNSAVVVNVVKERLTTLITKDDEQ